MFKKIKNEVKVKAVKSHIEKHKWVYVGVAGGILTGAMITYVIFAKRGVVVDGSSRATMIGSKGGVIMRDNYNLQLQIKGPPGNVIEDLDTGIMYPSQNT